MSLLAILPGSVASYFIAISGIIVSIVLYQLQRWSRFGELSYEIRVSPQLLSIDHQVRAKVTVFYQEDLRSVHVEIRNTGPIAVRLPGGDSEEGATPLTITHSQ